MKTFLILVFSITLLFSSCHKNSGAVCRDGTISHSTGRGTCSWHGGVDHYIDTNEVSIPKTIELVVLKILAGNTLIQLNKKK